MPLLDPRNGTAFDLPPSELRRVYLVASTPRTASTLLCRTLWNTGRAAAPKEYCNPMQARDWAVRDGAVLLAALPSRAAVLWERRLSPTRRRAHLAKVLAHRTQDGLFGLKLQADQLQRWFGDLDGLSRALAPPLVIRLTRDDRDAQAASWVRALQTGQWAAHQPAARRLVMPPGALSRARRAIDAQEDAWDVALQDVPALQLTSERVMGELSACLRDVLAHIGVNSSGPMPPAALSRQSPARGP